MDPLWAPEKFISFYNPAFSNSLTIWKFKGSLSSSERQQGSTGTSGPGFEINFAFESVRPAIRSTGLSHLSAHKQHFQLNQSINQIE